MIVLDIEKKLKAYSGTEVLRIEKQFNAGSINLITGPSGAGKTTLLKMIAGVIKPDNGHIVVNEQTWFNAAEKINITPQQRRTGFVFQDYALFPNMTVRQHLNYATTNNDWIDQLLAIGKLNAFANHKPNHLSGGQQQRLAILRALAIKPAVLLMDEPFSALDVKTKTELLADLNNVFKELAATVLIVSHNPQELKEIASDELIIGEDYILPFH
ncbi:ATP-binding cassette domain-containing protein [Mucilaginibacter terrenus]|uniref:ATP-binding cassette domain-containing protein n=1 Tax=Mucilaginibacter terrenus TaxID=2482727 RepID=A0A3E2NPQ0_9SPHI|nr:ATP-binding cassette domain-containing protein [Mucilaginibacter terrenus]RFZ82931.1 ATP-binding cassette domain-containing protein [Mucilaginibacter terrenus]